MKVTLLFIVNYLLIINYTLGQIDTCTTSVLALEKMEATFSRHDIDLLKHKVDSISNLDAEACPKVGLLTNVLYGRYYGKLGKPESAFDYLDKAMNFANEKNSSLLAKKILHYTSIIEKDRGNLKEALALIDSAYHIDCTKDTQECDKFNVRLSINSAVALQKIGDFNTALDKLYKAEKDFIEKNLTDSMYRVSISNMMGNIYYSQFRNLNESIRSYEKALQFIPNNHNAQYLLYNNIGSRYAALNKLDSAKIFFSKTIDNIDSPRYLIKPNEGLGDIAVKNKDLNGAREYYEKSVMYAEKNKNTSQIIWAQGALAKVNYLLGDYSTAKQLYNAINANLRPDHLSPTETQEIMRFKYLVDIAVQDEPLSKNVHNFFIESDSLNKESRIAALDKSITKYEKLILRDSLDKQILIKENEEQKVKNYQLSTGMLLMSIFFLAWLVFQFKNLFSKQKEVNEELVFQNNELQKLNEQLEQKTLILSTIPKLETGPKELSLKTKDKTYFIPLDIITYVQAEDEGVRVYFNDTSKWTDVSLKSFYQELEDTSFVQIGKGIVVNVRHIAWINTNTLKMKTGAELKIGRVYKPKIKEVLES